MLSKNLQYPYGFIFSDQSISNYPEYYKQLTLLDKYFYYYDDRETPQIKTTESTFIIIHGNFIHIGSETNLSNIELADYLLTQFSSNYEEFLNTLDFVGGRYAIMIGNNEKVEIFNDASAMRSVFYALDHNIATSHYYLMKEIIPTKPFALSKKYGSLDFTYDRSPSSNVHAIMPNFKLDFSSKELVRFFPRSNNKYTDYSVNDRYNLFEKLWKGQVDYCVNNYDDIAFSLTGGNDSRISLAMLKEHKDKIRMFTYAAVTDTEDVKDKFEASHDNDRIILEQMKSNLDLNHEFYFFRDNKLEFSKEASKALAKNVYRSHGRFLVAYYMQSFPKERSLHIRANLLEIGRAYLISPTTKNTIEEVTKSFIPYALNKTRGKKDDIEDLINYTNTQNNKFYSSELFDYHLLDLAFWETRMGRWHAEIVNETDIAFQSFIPYNMRALIDISLSFSYSERKSISFFRNLINRNYPVLNFFGYNNFKNLYEQSSEQGANIHSPYAKYRNNIFNNFQIYNNSNELIRDVKNNDNTVYISKDLLKTNYYSEINFTYEKKRGHLNLALRSPYSSKTGKNTLRYEIYCNNELLLKEDMTSWKFRNNISIFNLKKDDEIKIKVVILKDLKGTIWENASRLILREYTEYSSLKDIPQKISATSPESVLYN